MKLHNGSLYWPQTVSHVQAYPELQDTITCDVLIVGGECLVLCVLTPFQSMI
ncbi:hypothetical protein MGI18_27105 [Bacillus sp. OVS6]|nr:hypothetical protein MGI18_27105 [Bacillus sp. OVS6]